MAQRKKSSTAGLIFAAIGAVLVCAGGYAGLVVREDALATRTEQYAESLEAELRKGRGYLRARPENEALAAEMEAVAGEIARRIPVGRVDYELIRYLEQKVTEIGLEDFAYDFVGGMALPEDTKPQQARLAEQLSGDPTKLQTVQLKLHAFGTLHQMVAFQKALADAPWIVEQEGFTLIRIDPSDKGRGPSAAQRQRGVRTEKKDPGIQATLAARYYHQ